MGADALAGVDNADAVLSDVYARLQTCGLVQVATSAASEKSTAAKQACEPVLTTKRFESIFSKELKSRERAAGPHGVSRTALACLHDWDGTGTAGMRCQVCDFETKDRSYTCALDCGVRLCGKCWWKWKEKA